MRAGQTYRNSFTGATYDIHIIQVRYSKDVIKIKFYYVNKTSGNIEGQDKAIIKREDLQDWVQI